MVKHHAFAARHTQRVRLICIVCLSYVTDTDIDIFDDEVPRGVIPPETTEIDIFDNDTPRGVNPDTGVNDASAGLAIGAVGSALAIGLSAKKHKKK